MGSLKDETIARLLGHNPNPGDSIDGVEKQAKDMNVVQGALSTARTLSGASALEAQIEDANKRAEKAAEAARKAEEDKHRAEIDKVEATLGAKIDGLAKSYTGGASQEKIADQIAEIKKAANELGMGGSKVSELREMMTLITSLNPQKTMIEQIKDAKELIGAIMPAPDKGNGVTVGGMPATIALEIKKMDTNLQITLQKMQDERQERHQEFELRMKQYELDRADRIAEAQGKIQVEQDRNKLIAGGLDTIGRAVGRGMVEGSRGGAAAPGSVAGRPTQEQKVYHIEVAPEEGATFDCPHCKTKIAVGPDSTQAQCVGCNTTFPIVRKAAAAAPPAPPESEEE